MTYTASYLVDPTWKNFIPGQVIKFSFLSGFPLTDYPEDSFTRDTYVRTNLTGFSEFTPEQQAAVRSLFADIAKLTNVTFVEETLDPTQADIRFGMASMQWGGLNARMPKKATGIRATLNKSPSYPPSR